MHDTHRHLLVSTAQGDLCLAVTYLREVDSCLRRVDLSEQDRVTLGGQTQVMHRLLSRIDLWLTIGTEDLDEEMARLSDDAA